MPQVRNNEQAEHNSAVVEQYAGPNRAKDLDGTAVDGDQALSVIARPEAQGAQTSEANCGYFCASVQQSLD
jgi:hypothetical protein